MLKFICDNCKEEYTAHRRISSITYTDAEHTQTYSVDTEDDPCFQCEAVAEKAKQEALEKRKKHA